MIKAECKDCKKIVSDFVIDKTGLPRCMPCFNKRQIKRKEEFNKYKDIWKD